MFITSFLRHTNVFIINNKIANYLLTGVEDLGNIVIRYEIGKT